MKPASLVALRSRLHLSRVKFAAQIGVGRGTLTLYEAGQSPIPRTVALACAAIAFGLPPME